jgi:hypothetical protein
MAKPQWVSPEIDLRTFRKAMGCARYEKSAADQRVRN